MKCALLTRCLIGLAVVLLMTDCSGPADVAVSPAVPSPGGPAAHSIPFPAPLQARLTQYVMQDRTIFYSDFGYDGKGRQASVWTYNQRTGEGKNDTPQTVLTYNDQNQLLKAEDGFFTVDAVTGAVLKADVIRRQEFTYSTSSVAVKTTMALSAEYPAGPAVVYEFDDAEHIVRQTEQYADGSATEKKYQYTNGNVVQRDVVLTNAVGQVTARFRDSYAYDTAPNPLFGLLGQSALIDVPAYASKNNPVRWTNQTRSPTDATVVTATVDHTYTYNYTVAGLPAAFLTGTTLGTYTYAN